MSHSVGSGTGPKATPPPGQHAEVTIERLVFQGNGLGHLPDGRVVFVPGSVPGDRLEVRICEARTDFAQADLVRVLDPSPSRVVPSCRYFGICGGCQWQQLTYAAQLDWKRQILQELLRRVGKLGDLPTFPTLALGQPWGYRARAQFKVVGGARPCIGFHRRETNRVVDIEQCPLLTEQLNAVLRTLRGMRHPSFYQLFERLREVWVSAGTGTGEVLVSLFAHARDRGAIRLLFHTLQAAVPGLTGVVLMGGDPRQNSHPVDRHGQGMLHEQVGTHRFQVDATAFFQVNGRAAERLTDLVVQASALGGSERVLDLYCGVGTFTVPLARRAREVVGAEANAAAAADAVANLRENDCRGAHVVPAQVEQALSGLAEKGRWDLVVLDPPRQGVSRRLVEGMAAIGVPRLIYVSCDPSTLARDLALLTGAGYRCASLQPVDLFPQTFHLETVAVLDREK
jgi:23S rRNA (uracil1939-C5)-methyltransferase